jgi:hypothetical protein
MLSDIIREPLFYTVSGEVFSGFHNFLINCFGAKILNYQKTKNQHWVKFC